MQLYVVENPLSIKCDISAFFCVASYKADLWGHIGGHKYSAHRTGWEASGFVYVRENWWKLN